MSSFQEAAAGGIIEATAQIGYMYDKGLGVQRNYQKAADFWAKAAAQGDAHAMYDLGVCHQLGRGCKQNYRLAVMWYRRAAAKGLAPAMYAIGRLYELGHYDQGGGQPEQSYPLAAKWYRRAAAKGVASAMYAIGRLYAKGRGVNRNPQQAISWFRRAAEAGDLAAMRDMSAAYQVGWGVPKNQEKAAKWASNAADSRQFFGHLVGLFAQVFSQPLCTKLIRNGFDNRPCEIACKVLRSDGKLQTLAVVVLSDRATAALSESLDGRGPGAPGMIAIVARPHGKGRQPPSVLVNGNWQLGGTLGRKAFRYGAEIYRYNKKQDTWIPVDTHKQGK
jgi:hypothetical protein